jgi:TonB-linked SusC/RagA family outer membrane protein
MKKMILILLCLAAGYGLRAQSVIKGRVYDQETKQGLERVTISVKGTRLSTVSDVNGAFEIKTSSPNAVLEFSCTGYSPREIMVEQDRISYEIFLSKAVQALEEVVVTVAYGQQDRRKITGAIGKVPGKELDNIPLASVDQILQGKVAGLQSIATSGQPGSLQQIRIRGIGSITASSAPLYVIDGIPVNSGDASSLTNSSNLLAGLNPNDIENVSVLKDASAASIYGSRAANGVIIISTKKGRAGKTQISVDTEIGSNDIAYQPSMGKPLNKSELKTLYTEGMENVGFGQADIDYILDLLGFSDPRETNWLNEVTRKGQQQQLNISLSGGNNQTQFFLSGGYFKQMSPVIGSFINRYNGNLSVKHQISSRFKVSANLNLSNFRQKGESESANFRNPIIAATALRPTQHPYNADGTLNYDRSVFDQIYNPLAIQQYDRQQNLTSKLLGGLLFEYKLLDNLTLSSRMGIDYNNIEEYEFLNPYFGDADATQGAIYNTYTRIYNYVWTNLADYGFHLMKDKIDGTLTAAYEAQKSKTYLLSADGEVVPKNLQLPYPIPAVPKSANLSGSDYSFVSILSRGQLNMLGKYSLSASLRRDGSSRFGADNRYGTFWSVGAAWNIDEEKFMQRFDYLSALKLRASYGVNGNAGIGNYAWRATYAFNTTYNGAPGSLDESVGNPHLTWEQNKPFDVGLELGLFDNRLMIESDYYYRKTTQLLLNEPLSATSGFISYSNNVGAMENKGFEITINASPVKTRNFTWNISVNAAWNKNKVLKLREDANEIFLNPNLIKVGYDVQSYYLRQWAGADPANGDPLWYTDASKKSTTNNFSDADRVISGSSSPKGFGGVSSSLRYKFITLDFQFNYQYGNYLYNQWDFIFLGDGAFFTLNHNRRELDRWRQPNDITSVPRFEFFNNTSSNEVSTRYLYKGDFIRLRNLSLRVSLPYKITRLAHATQIDIYVRGTNLWTKTFDKNLTMDPEQPVSGLSDLQFFIPKSYTAGISIKL